MFKKIVGCMMAAVVFSSTVQAVTKSPIVVRAAIDMGTGGPKLQVAEVNLETGKIVQILHTDRFFVSFHDSLKASQSLSLEIMSQGLQAFQRAVKKAESFNPQGIVAVATAAFRRAKNGQEFADLIQTETDVKVHVIDQKLEGELPFMAVLAKTDLKPHDLLVWDIGGGSTQFVITGTQGSCHIDGSREGSGPFRDHIIEKIQGRSIHDHRSPNPLSDEHVMQALAHAQTLAEKVDQVFKQQTKKVVGVGSVFGGVAKRVGKDSFTREELKAVVKKMVNKNDEELGGGDFACVEASNAIFALGFMEGLQIEEMHIVDVNNADGALIYAPFWE